MKETIKNIFLALVLVFALGLGYVYVGNQEAKLGGVGDGISYQGVTSGATTCSGSTSTLISAAQPGRTSFIASLNTSTSVSGSAVFLCRSSVCLANTGIVLATSTPRWEQTDGYIGPYSCIAATASTSIATSLSN